MKKAASQQFKIAKDYSININGVCLSKLSVYWKNQGGKWCYVDNYSTIKTHVIINVQDKKAGKFRRVKYAFHDEHVKALYAFFAQNGITERTKTDPVLFLAREKYRPALKHGWKDCTYNMSYSERKKAGNMTTNNRCLTINDGYVRHMDDYKMAAVRQYAEKFGGL